jgi:hypothetical protein
MHNPRAPHLAMLKWVLRYIRGTTTHGLLLRASAELAIMAYSDADWGGCPDTRHSTSGFCIFLGDSLVSWSSKRQATVSRSNAEAEYRAVANAAAECIWVRQLLGELGCGTNKATVVFCDNISAVYMSSNLVHHKRTKHIELDINFVREHVQIGELVSFMYLLANSMPMCSLKVFLPRRSRPFVPVSVSFPRHIRLGGVLKIASIFRLALYLH